MKTNCRLVFWFMIVIKHFYLMSHANIDNGD